MSIQTNSPSTNLGTSVSAEEIAALLGFADAAAMAAATEAGELTTPALTGGTSTAYTLTDTRIGTPTDGQIFAFRVHAICGASPTLAVNGGAAIGLARICADGVNRALIAGQVQVATAVIVRYYAADVAYQVIAGLVLGANDIPPTLNATTFGGYITATGTYGVVSSSGSSYTYFCGGSNPGQTYGAYMSVQSGGFSTGDLLLYPSNLTGSCIRLYDKNGAERSRADANGLSALSPVVSVGTSFTTICAVAGNQALMVATVTGIGSILLEWDGSTLTKLAGVSTLVVAGSAGAGETAFRVSGGNLQAIVDTGARNVSSGFSVRH